MQTLFGFIFFGSIIAWFIGLAKPSLFTRFFKSQPNRKKLTLIFGLLGFVSLIMIGVAAPEVKKEPESLVKIQDKQIVVSTTPEQVNKDSQVKTEAVTTVQTARPKEEAQKELDELINLGKQAGLFDSYEFSKTASVVYVGPAWYSQKVTFKKDILAKLAMLKEEITGFKHLEIRDVQSNEKVAEVTAFGGSLEVYK
ncbi:MAG: hypothetical protein WC725_01960 [Patescibacteria group bacterium]